MGSVLQHTLRRRARQLLPKPSHQLRLRAQPRLMHTVDHCAQAPRAAAVKWRDDAISTLAIRERDRVQRLRLDRIRWLWLLLNVFGRMFRPSWPPADQLLSSLIHVEYFNVRLIVVRPHKNSFVLPGHVPIRHVNESSIVGAVQPLVPVALAAAILAAVSRNKRKDRCIRFALAAHHRTWFQFARCCHVMFVLRGVRPNNSIQPTPLLGSYVVQFQPRGSADFRR